ncbi:hypothetical protein V5279_23955 [Bradyrhizobium sp. 26S5]|jgi:hypothetical protein|uniref:hypothetical protein n=1 Tax=unclassified Bradyrhizobium TaxID=2631580 RepID=UPI001407EE37|nr:hypothetical protein [Bradyrhizobium sp. 2S1]MCK7670233.1 hypothetical protein [Bradyrhizobium sp. 2S1]
MRIVLALGLLIIMSASATAATKRHSHARQPATARSFVDVTPRARFAVPGWSDESTRQWLDNASSGVGLGG